MKRTECPLCFDAGEVIDYRETSMCGFTIKALCSCAPEIKSLASAEQARRYIRARRDLGRVNQQLREEAMRRGVK